MRIIPIVSAVVGLAACGGAKQPATAAPSESGGTDTVTPAAGTSGLPGLDWGASADAVVALYPRATPDEAGVVYVGTVEGHQAVEHFTIGTAGLSQVDIEWTDGFVSMGDCEKTWDALRTSLDGRFGPSQSDNGAAYWDLPTASVTLACNPNDNNAGVLSMSYGQREVE